jgi:hypothetical protein
MQVWNASLTVTNSSFVNNRMSVTAGAYGNMMGGGLCYEGRRLQMDNVVLASNSLGPPDRNCQEARGGGKTHTDHTQREIIYTHTEEKHRNMHPLTSHTHSTHSTYRRNTETAHRANAHPCI